MNHKFLLPFVCLLLLRLVSFSQQVTPDSSFAGTGIFTSTPQYMRWFEWADVNALALQSGNKILVGTSTSDDFGYTGLAMVQRLSANGTHDRTFAYNGVLTTGSSSFWARLSSLAVQPDNKIVTLSREYLHYDYPRDTVWLQRYLPNGSLDSSFGINGSVFFRKPYEVSNGEQVLVKPSGSIVARFVSAGVRYITQFYPSGRRDTSFGTGGSIVSHSVYDQNIRDLIALPDNKLLASYVYANGNTYSSCLVRYTPNGNIDSSFGSNGVFFIGNSFAGGGVALKLQPDNKLLVYTGDGSNSVVYRYNTNGTPDASFGNEGKAVISSFAGAADQVGVQADGKVVVSSVATRKLARLLPSGVLDTEFGTSGILDISWLGYTYGFLFVPAGNRLVIAGDLYLPSQEASVYRVAVFKPCTECSLLQNGAALYTNRSLPSVAKPVSVQVYPNPAVNSITLQGLGNGESVIRITNATGIAVSQYKTASATYRCDVSALPAGMYGLSVWQNNRPVFSTQLVKQQ